MTPLPLDYFRCVAGNPDHYCTNCKRWSEHPDQQVGSRTGYVYVENSKTQSCCYIPISLQESKS